ncbi:hypothetical protein BC828DRAFT_106095 [Blastocladiella britannica]|nr:hypothetical protein BC828DRAFT_106095 [Blastocladiella britannica]
MATRAPGTAKSAAHAPAAAAAAAAAQGSSPHSPELAMLADVPLIFQCSNCLTIVGDSSAWWTVVQEGKGIALFAKHDNVRLSGEPLNQSDLILQDIICGKCETPLGEYLIEPPKGNEILREKYCYALDTITWYAL